MITRHTEEVIPSAARLGNTLRDVGYDFKTAIADLIDNSIAAQATRVEITARFKQADSWIRIADNGTGMDSATLTEALRFGTRRQYSDGELGKFGLGLKTSSLSQGRRLQIATRANGETLNGRVLDLDLMRDTDRWDIERLDFDVPRIPGELQRLNEPLRDGRSGTVVIWGKLDRMLLDRYKQPGSKFAERGFWKLIGELEQHLGMVFHRFLSGEVYGREQLSISINKKQVHPWDPFARTENATQVLMEHEFQVVHNTYAGRVIFRPYVLPNRQEFSSTEAFNSAGRRQWNLSQGLWIYRGERLIQDGGWSNIRNPDEHIKFARASLDFFPDLDDAFKINIAKMTVHLPTSVREDLKKPIAAFTKYAQKSYRTSSRVRSRTTSRKQEASTSEPSPHGSEREEEIAEPRRSPFNSTTNADLVAEPSGKLSTSVFIRATLEKAAVEAGESSALARIMEKVRQLDRGVADAIGW